MQEILRAPASYGMIKEAESLIQSVEAADAALSGQHRERARSAIDEQIGRIQLELDAAKAASDLRNACLHPLQSLKREVEAQISIAHIDQAAVAAVDLADEAFQRIEAAARQQAEKPGVGEVAPKPYVKRRVVKPAALAPKTLLETKEDIDAYLDTLRRALEDAIGAGERVEIR